MAGDFIWSLTYTDIATQWTEGRAVWHKGAAGVLAATRPVAFNTLAPVSQGRQRARGAEELPPPLPGSLEAPWFDTPDFPDILLAK